ncbi:MAG: hypothetical protein NVSMB56_04740 [Pyrinomonadaceae bacterium]
MPNLKLLMRSFALMWCGVVSCAAQQAQQAQPTAAAAAPALIQWKDDFDGNALDTKKWEQYSIEGGGLLKVADGKLQMHGAGGSRAGVRTAQSFNAARFVVNAKLARVAAGIGDSGVAGTPTGNAVLAVLFDNVGANRLEWILTTEGRFEAWLIRDGRSERLDARNRGTKEKSPTLGIARRGDDFFFLLNGEVGLQKNIKNLPQTFRVMLYGFSTSQNDWDSVSVITPVQ